MRAFQFSKISLRVWMGLSIALMTICLVLVLTLSSMAPRVKVLPQLFTPDTMRFGQFIEATNLGAPVKEGKLIDEMLVRFYVENRHIFIPDRAEMIYRYGPKGPVARLSAPKVYQEFMKKKGNYLEKLQDKSNTTTTTADIINITRRDNTFTVDFDIYSFDGGKPSFGGTRRATVRIGYNPKMPSSQRFRKDFANPYGVFVALYDETVLKK